MVEKLRGFSKGIGIFPNFVEHSTYWLVNSEKKILGVANIRHRLNGKLRKRGGHIGFGVCPSERNKGYATEMLKLALEKARDLGITKALLTCDKSNVASARVIRKNGGRLDSEEVLEDHMIQRYWIDT